jgi:hypothetical protein
VFGLRSRPTIRFVPSATSFLQDVNWLTFARAKSGQDAVHRKAQADFNFRGWQGRWRHTAPTALFFIIPPCIDFFSAAGSPSSQAGDLRSRHICS